MAIFRFWKCRLLLLLFRLSDRSFFLFVLFIYHRYHQHLYHIIIIIIQQCNGRRMTQKQRKKKKVDILPFQNILTTINGERWMDESHAHNVNTKMFIFMIHQQRFFFFVITNFFPSVLFSRELFLNNRYMIDFFFTFQIGHHHILSSLHIIINFLKQDDGWMDGSNR